MGHAPVIILNNLFLDYQAMILAWGFAIFGLGAVFVELSTSFPGEDTQIGLKFHGSLFGLIGSVMILIAIYVAIADHWAVIVDLVAEKGNNPLVPLGVATGLFGWVIWHSHRRH